MPIKRVVLDTKTVKVADNVEKETIVISVADAKRLLDNTVDIDLTGGAKIGEMSETLAKRINGSLQMVEIKTISNSKIRSVSDCLDCLTSRDNSSYQKLTIRQIVKTKGGTKHLVRLLKSGKLEIDDHVLWDLSKNTSNVVEKKCYEILLSVIDEIEWQKEEQAAYYAYYDWIEEQKFIEQSYRDAMRPLDADDDDDFNHWDDDDY